MILDAAAQITADKGVLGLTVEQVVGRAGVSKGAFFHHFKTKEDMTRAMLERILADFEARLEARAASGTPFPEALITLAMEQFSENVPLMASIVAAVAVEPSLRDIIRAYYQRCERQLLDTGMSREQVCLLQLALDGLLLSSSMQIICYDAERLAMTRRAMLALLQTPAP